MDAVGEHRLRVRYDECDSMGITYHARYLDWFVIGRTELLRNFGLPYARLERAGLLLPVLEARCRYVASTRYDDLVRVETQLVGVTRTRVRFAYRVFLEPSEGDELAAGAVTAQAVHGGAAANERAANADGEPGSRELPKLVAEGETMHAFVDERHRPVDVKKRFPDVWAKLEPLAAALRSAGG